MPTKPPKKAPKGVNTTGIKRPPRNLSRSDEKINDKEFKFSPLPEKLMKIIEKKGLVNWIKSEA